MQQHTAELEEVRLFTRQMDENARFNQGLRTIASQSGNYLPLHLSLAMLTYPTKDLESMIQSLYLVVPALIGARSCRLHLYRRGVYLSNPFGQDHQSTETIRNSITGLCFELKNVSCLTKHVSATCFKSGRIAVHDEPSNVAEYNASIDRITGSEGFPCAFIPLMRSNGSVIAVLIFAFSEFFE